MGRCFRCASIFAACLAFSCSLPAFQMNGQGLPGDRNRELSGNVYYADTGAAADHVSVQISNSVGEVHGPATTSSSGYFEFHDLTLGSYEITITVPGYETFTQTEELTFSSVEGLAIYLKPMNKDATAEAQNHVSAHELSMPEKDRALVASGEKKLYSQKDPGGALKDFQQAVTDAPGYYEAIYQIAMTYISQGDQASAEKYLRKSQDASGDKYGEADVGLGTLLLNRGDIAGAEKAIRHGIELDPTEWLGFYELGRAELARNDLVEAKKSAEQARSLAPNAPLVYRLLTNIDLRQKDYTAALQDIDAYLKLDPGSELSARAKVLRQQIAQKVASPDAAPPPGEAKP